MSRPAALAFVAILTLPVVAGAGWTIPAGGESASGDPEVLFTFDDGPHEKYTGLILDELDKRDITAIFFWVGWRILRGYRTEHHLDLVRRAVSDGHLIANHTVTHADLCAVEETLAAEEIDRNTRAYQETTGLPIVLFRAPYGANCERLRRMLKERALDHTHWDIDPQEWRHHNAKRTVRFVTNRLKRLDGRAIILLHDTHRVTVKALPEILDWIDKENQRRIKTGKRRPIRIISSLDFLTERLDRAVLDWMAHSAADSANQLHSALARLIP